MNGQKQIGGEDKIVNLDEAKISKRKYNTVIRAQWVFDDIERNTRRTFILPVPNRYTETLLPIIQYVAAGSITRLTDGVHTMLYVMKIHTFNSKPCRKFCRTLKVMLICRI